MPEPGRLLFPAFPKPRALPWALVVASAAALAFGLISGNPDATTLGIVGLAGAGIGFGLARLVLGPAVEDEAPPPEPPSVAPPQDE